MGNIKILEKSIALKIAAGEVIDRPASVLRELLDNSIDAGSSEISVYIESSGMKEIRIIDNGAGMDEEDLKLSVMQHATSKIETAEDLFNIQTLGFRGEALSSIAASSRLEIISGTESNSPGKILKTDTNGEITIAISPSRKGTTVSVKDLFYAIPARKQFLKNPSAETNLCKNIFYEKAAAKPDITFKLYIDGSLIQMLGAGTLKERIFDCYNAAFKDKVFLYEIEKADYSKYSIKGVMADPALFRKDRKFIHIYLNGRRIQDYSLTQAITYGYSEFMPGGHFPSAFIFIEDDPSLVDFNIHPAKKEAKIKNLPQIHHSLTELIKTMLKKNLSVSGAKNEKSFVSNKTDNSDSINFYQQNFPNTVYEKSYTYKPDKYLKGILPEVKKNSCEIPVTLKPSESESLNSEISNKIKYLGQLFNIFLLCEKNNSLYIIDQHAAHEKSIYESLINKKAKIQKLLVPIYLPEDIVLTQEMIDKYKETGIIIEQDDTKNYFIDSLPEILNNIKNNIAAVISESPGNIDEVYKKLFSTASCKKAIKGGDYLSDMEAAAIIEAAFSLKSPYCPHGRPVWKCITKDELLQQINRIV